MLGALLAALPILNLPDIPDTPTEDDAEDNHWAGDKNRFEDWLLNGDAIEADQPDGDYYY